MYMIWVFGGWGLVLGGIGVGGWVLVLGVGEKEEEYGLLDV